MLKLPKSREHQSSRCSQTRAFSGRSHKRCHSLVGPEKRTWDSRGIILALRREMAPPYFWRFIYCSTTMDVGVAEGRKPPEQDIWQQRRVFEPWTWVFFVFIHWWVGVAREERRDILSIVLVLCWRSKNSIALAATSMSVGVALYCVAGEEREKRDMSLPLSSLSFVLVGRRFVNVYLR